MDLKGPLIDTKIKIYPSEKLIDFINNLNIDDDIPENFLKFIKVKNIERNKKQVNNDKRVYSTQLTNKDIEILNKLKQNLNKTNSNEVNAKKTELDSDNKLESGDEFTKKSLEESVKSESKNVTHPVYSDGLHLTTSDMDWLFNYLQKNRHHGKKDIPYLHELLENIIIKMPENKIIKRNPVLEARCVKLRAQQEAREYRKMTKSVDNVRMRFPEDSISYQLKSLNRQLIAVGQFVISIFAGFLFGFRGIEWMVGNLDFGFRLLLGVMCALVIALAEIYFLAKKLNEEFNMPETVQLGGPPKFADETKCKNKITEVVNKEHQD